jgi:hypothetical protein
MSEFKQGEIVEVCDIEDFFYVYRRVFIFQNNHRTWCVDGDRCQDEELSLNNYNSGNYNITAWNYCRKIKEPGYIPFDNTDALLGLKVREKEFINKGLIIKQCKDGIETGIGFFSYKLSFEKLEFLDGKPFGKIKE